MVGMLFWNDMMEFLPALLRRATFLRYVIASVGALAVDMGIFLSAMQFGVAHVAAAALGYICGIFAHWILSSRTVFQDRVSGRGTSERTKQKAMFIVSALLGLGVTTGIVALGGVIDVDPRIAKLVAIAVSFQMTFMLRNLLIFRTS
jgi:putative flippase GtrA